LAPDLVTRCCLPLLLLVSFGACADRGVVTASYGTLAEARQAGAIASGRIPEGLPPGTREMREAFDPGMDRRWGLFDFPAAEGAHLKALLEASERPLGGDPAEPPRRIEWWPLVLRGAPDDERIRATGLRTYRSRDGELTFAVNWNQGRAYYWTAAAK
jgi:hypothetical protein